MPNHAAVIRARVQADHPGATVRRRGRRFIEHTLPDGRIQWTGTACDMHYGPTADQEIDTTWQVAQAPDAWSFTAGDYSATVRPTFSVGQIITFGHRGQTVDLQPQALQWSNALSQIQQIVTPLPVPAVPDDAVMRWTAAYGPGIDFDFTLLPGRLQKHLTINSLANLVPPNATILAGGNPYLRFQFIFQRSNGVRLWANGSEWTQGPNSSVETTGPVEFRSAATGEVLWTFSPPTAMDGNDKPVVGMSTYLRRQGNNLFVEVRVPWAYLQTAVFPVVIDPEFTTSGSDDTYMDSTAPTWAGGDTYTRFLGGDRVSSSQQNRGLIRFTLTSIPTTATITDCTFYGWTYKNGDVYAGGDSANPFYQLRAARDWVSGQASWNIFKTSNNWTTAGVNSSTSDRYATAIGSWPGTTAAPEGTGKTSSWNASMVQDWTSGALVNNGVVFTGLNDNDDLYAIFSSDEPTTGYRPYLVINYVTTTYAELAGTVAGVGTLSGAATLRTAIAGTMTGVGVVTGSATLLSNVAGTVVSSGSVTGSLSLTSNVAGVLVGAATFTGEATLLAVLSCTLAGSGVVTGDTSPESNAMTGALAGTGNAAANLTTAIALAGSLEGVGAPAGDLSLIAMMAGNVSGVGVVSGALFLTSTVAGSIVGSGVVAGDLSSLVAMAGVWAGVGALSGENTLLVALTGMTSGQSTMIGALSLSSLIAGNIIGAGAFTGDVSLSATAVMAGVLVGLGALNGDVGSIVNLGGSVVGVGTIVGDGTLITQLLGTISGVGVLGAGVSLSSLLAGLIVGSSTFDVDLTTDEVIVLIPVAGTIFSGNGGGWVAVGAGGVGTVTSGDGSSGVH